MTTNLSNLSIGRKFLSAFDEPLLKVLTGLSLASSVPFRTFPDYETILNTPAREAMCPDTRGLINSGSWFLDFYLKSVVQSDVLIFPPADLLETYLSSPYVFLSDVVSRELFRFVLRCRKLTQRDYQANAPGSNDGRTNAPGTKSIGTQDDYADLSSQFNLALKELLRRIHLGAILIGELKWRSNTSLICDLLKNKLDSSLLEHITSISAEAQLKKRLLDLSESIPDKGSLGVFNPLLTISDRCLLREEVICFFCDRIVHNTKKGQCEFIKLHTSA